VTWENFVVRPKQSFLSAKNPFWGGEIPYSLISNSISTWLLFTLQPCGQRARDKLLTHSKNTDPTKSIAQRHENENIFTYLPRNWIRIELKLDLTHCRYTCHSLRFPLAFCFAFNCLPLVLLPFQPHQAFSGYFPPPPAEPMGQWATPLCRTLIIVIEFAKLRLKYNGLVCHFARRTINSSKVLFENKFQLNLKYVLQQIF